MKKFFSVLLASALLCTVIDVQSTKEVKAAESSVQVECFDDQVTIGNGYLERVFAIEDGHLATEALHNKRIDRTLVPQAGSQDFLIETLVEKQGEDVLPQEPLARSAWKGTVTGSGSDHVEDAANLFDGDDTSETDYYVTGTDFPYTLTIDLGKEETFQAFSYQKRQGNANVAWGINGTVGKYRLQVSQDNKTWIDAGAGEFTREDYNLHEVDGIYNIGDMVYGSFDQVYTARYVRLISESGALSDEKTFNGAEFYLYKDAYVPQEEPPTTVNSHDLTVKDTVVTDTESGGKKLDFIFEPYTLNDITWNFTYSVVMEAGDHFMRSYVEATTDKEEAARMDYLELDHFVLSDDVEGIWYRPDDFKVADGAYNFLHTEMLLGQPIYADGMFFGSEFPATDTKIADDTMQIRYYSGKTIAQLREENRLTRDGKFVSWPNVIGAAQGTQTNVVQTDFFAYIDTIATETSFRKQYNSWYDNRMGINDERIAATFYGTEKGLAQQGYAPLDAYVVDDGWNNYNDPTYTGIDVERSGNSYNRTGFWEFNDKFPNELYTASEMADKFDASFGLWLGPQGGYELYSTFSKYIESSETGYVHPTAALGDVICTGSKKYIDNLTDLFVDYQERFDIDYWKLDGFASRPCTQSDHDHMTGGYNNMYFTSELWENWTDTFEAMRAQRAAEGKGLYINATCYVIPSPWMLQWVNTVWQHNAGDLEQDGTNGGSSAQKMISGRDNIYFRNDREAQLQFPLKNVYNHEPIYGTSAGVNMTSEEFRQYMMANAVRGTSFWELYFSPSMMDEAKWQITADILTFAEENEHILQHAKLFGNAPKTGSVYGYSSWDEAEGIISFRNPTNKTQSYTLKLDELVGVSEAVQDVKQWQVLPYTAEAADTTISYGDELTVTLAPYEEIVYQFTNEVTAAPKVVYAKVMDEHTIRVKFDQRIEDTNVYKINGAAVKMQLLDDYRTVELTCDAVLAENAQVEVTIDQLHSIHGNALQTKLALTSYDDHMLAAVNDKADLQDSDAVAESVFAHNGVTFLGVDDAYALTSENSLQEATKDFTVSMLVQTTSTDAVLLQQDGMTIGIDADGYLTYHDDVIELSSESQVTTVVEKASGRYGTAAYVPTSSKIHVEGRINDGNKHAISVVRELNGMVKLYVDGTLMASAYADGAMASFTAAPLYLGSETLQAQLGDVRIYDRALGYDEIEALQQEYQLSDEDSELDKSQWSATADSEESNGAANEGPASYAIDGDPSTLWHTEYRNSKPVCPHWLQIDLGQISEFDKLAYVSRNGNGSVRQYTLEVSDDAKTWTTISEGELPKEGTTMLTFDERQSARYLRLHVLSSYGVDSANENIFGAVAEISLYQEHPAPTDYSALAALVQTAASYEEAAYTNTSYAALQEALTSAYRMLQDVNATQAHVDAMQVSLQAAIDALVERVIGDKSALEAMLQKADELKQEDYTEDSWEQLLAAKEAAKQVMDDVLAEQDAIDEACEQLERAMDALVEKPEEPTPSTERQQLEELLAQYEALDGEAYTNESWTVFVAARDAAKVLLKDSTVSDAQLGQALQALRKAIEQLQKAEPSQPVEPDDPKDEPSEKPNDTQERPQDDDVATGIGSMAGTYMIVLGACIITLWQLRHRSKTNMR